MKQTGLSIALILLTAPAIGLRAATNEPGTSSEAWLVPYSGPTRADVDATTLDGFQFMNWEGGDSMERAVGCNPFRVG